MNKRPMTDHEKRQLVEAYVDAYNAFDVDGMMATLHPEIEFTNVLGDDVTARASGISAFREMAEQATQLFASRKQTLTSFKVSEEGATITVAYEGTLAVDLPNGMKAGDDLHLDGRSEFRFKEGRIVWLADFSQ